MRIASCFLALYLGLTPPVVAASPTPAPGGAMQRSSVEGCLGRWLFNGVWRVRATHVNKSASYSTGGVSHGVEVALTVRNGTSQTLSPNASGFADINGATITLAYDNDNVVALDGSGDSDYNAFWFKPLPPGGSATVKLDFPYGSNKDAKPVKVLIGIDPHSSANTAHVTYSVSNPSFRIKLTCGTAT
jgi:hypothetical protein